MKDINTTSVSFMSLGSQDLVIFLVIIIIIIMMAYIAAFPQSGSSPTGIPSY